MGESKSRYQLVRKLATGGMAEVFLAKSFGPKGFEKTLVLKRILPHLAQQPSFVEMFLSEAMLAARLTHPHIVQIFDFGEAEGAYYLAMEYVDGPSLRALIRSAAQRQMFLPIPICARLVSQACDGLAFAHDFTEVDTGEHLGLVHRDISPDNLLLLRQGMVKVVDFGIAKAVGQGTKTDSGVVRGKLSYMPPEQLRAERLDRRADVYALGIVLYELLTNNRPHTSSTDVGLMHTILFDPPLPASHYRPELPEALLRILERATAKDREQRYPDCHAFQSDLEEFIHSLGRPVTAQQIAHLIQRTTAGAGLPTQRPLAEAQPPSMAAPLLSQPGSPGTEAMTAGDTQPDAPAPSPTLSLTRRVLPEPSPGGHAPRVPLKRRLVGSARMALAAGLFMLLGGGVVWKLGSRTPPVENATGGSGAASLPEPSVQAPLPAPAPLQTSPSEPSVPEPSVPESPRTKPYASKPNTHKNKAASRKSDTQQAPREEAPAEAPRAVEPAPVVPTAKALVFLDARPDAYVSVDGRSLDDYTPIKNVRLLAGPRLVEFTEAESGTPRTLRRSITLQPGQRVKVFANFDQGTVRIEEE